MNPEVTPGFHPPPSQYPGGQIPTPDSPHSVPGIRTAAENHIVQPGETLGKIAANYGITMENILSSNAIPNPNILSVGQNLIIPPPPAGSLGSAYKIIPDSELVNGPINIYFDIESFVMEKGGHLATYYEDVEGQFMSGAEIVTFVAQNYSVNPRLLLALLEYQTGWVTQSQSHLDNLAYPMGHLEPSRQGLYRQLAWAADNLNRGYYLWKADGLGNIVTLDNATIALSPEINAGTAGVQYLYGLLKTDADWQEAVSETGFQNTYQALYGGAFDYAVEPLTLDNLIQPILQLPFENSIPWTFTGGPHGGWGDGSAWAALDCAPPLEQLGCFSNDAWVVAMTDGVIVRS
ncbi:MAG: LysM peptidoglycan-binding domain-containing protein, partial [Chloroflexota bacterium]